MNNINFEPTTGSLNGQEEPQYDKNTFFFVDWSKMQKVEDMVLVLSAMGFGIAADDPYFKTLKPFLNLDNPIDMSKKK